MESAVVTRRTAVTHESEPRGPSAGPDTTFRLLERIRAGDQAALEALFARYSAPLQRWASGRLPRWARDVAETQDLVQETLLKAFKKIDSFEPAGEGALQGYLRTALKNRIVDELRRFNRSARSAAVDSQIVDDSPSPLDHAIGAEAVDRYERALNRLKPEDREIVIARVEMGWTYVEIVERLGRSTPEAARKAAQRALLRLAAEMRP